MSYYGLCISFFEIWRTEIHMYVCFILLLLRNQMGFFLEDDSEISHLLKIVTVLWMSFMIKGNDTAIHVYIRIQELFIHYDTKPITDITYRSRDYEKI